MKIKFITKLISAVCAAAMITSCSVMSVGALEKEKVNFVKKVIRSFSGENISAEALRDPKYLDDMCELSKILNEEKQNLTNVKQKFSQYKQKVDDMIKNKAVSRIDQNNLRVKTINFMHDFLKKFSYLGNVSKEMKNIWKGLEDINLYHSSKEMRFVKKDLEVFIAQIEKLIKKYDNYVEGSKNVIVKLQDRNDKLGKLVVATEKNLNKALNKKALNKIEEVAKRDREKEEMYKQKIEKIKSNINEVMRPLNCLYDYIVPFPYTEKFKNRENLKRDEIEDFKSTLQSDLEKYTKQNEEFKGYFSELKKISNSLPKHYRQLKGDLDNYLLQRWDYNIKYNKPLETIQEYLDEINNNPDLNDNNDNNAK